MQNKKELNIKYGSEGMFLHDDYKGAAIWALDSFKEIFDDLNDIKNSYISLGFHLKKFYLQCYYMDFGYDSMYEFCEANFGLDKSAVSRCISVFENFTIVEGGVHKMELVDKFKDYSYSQLCEMLSMSDKEREQIKPEMTIKQIREIKKNSAALGRSLDKLDSLLDVSRDVSPVATSQQEKFDYKEWINKKGIVLANYMKKLIPKKSSVALYIYGRNGKQICVGRLVDILEYENNGLYIRLWNDDDEIGVAIKNE